MPPAILDTLRRLHAAALASSDPEPNAMTVATAELGGRVHARMVLLKTLDERGLTFFTHYESDKGEQLAANPRIALCLHWKWLDPPAQVRIEGHAEKLPAGDSDAYFATRERLSQIGAWASLQSRTLPDRAALQARVREFERKFEGRGVPRPDEWGGYLVVPDMVEFWYAGAHRWNERERWDRVDGTWRGRMLYP
ncbi:MAG: pyridoxamine 5'-phosphate oxidase [Xanthomonadaceae bacterium]|nr:pyridoxamine 5'-phosphate oxidase [Xanthomonadaceae bacterium]